MTHQGMEGYPLLQVESEGYRRGRSISTVIYVVESDKLEWRSVSDE